MEQLIKATTIPFHAIRFTQNAQIVPGNTLSLERQKALSRYRAFQVRYHKQDSPFVNIEFNRQVSMAFSSSPSGKSPSAEPVFRNKAHIPPPSLPPPKAASASLTTDSYPPGTVSLEMDSAYLLQRGSFELRVAKGEISYIPALTMTIVTHYPEVRFEYVGGFNYVPPQSDTLGHKMNIKT